MRSLTVPAAHAGDDPTVVFDLAVPPFRHHWDRDRPTGSDSKTAALLWRLGGPLHCPRWFATELTAWTADGQVEPGADEDVSFDIHGRFEHRVLLTAAASLDPRSYDAIWDGRTLVVDVDEVDRARRKLVATPLGDGQCAMTDALLARRPDGWEPDGSCATVALTYPDAVAALAAALESNGAVPAGASEEFDGPRPPVLVLADELMESGVGRFDASAQRQLLQLAGTWTGAVTDLLAVAAALDLLPT